MSPCNPFTPVKWANCETKGYARPDESEIELLSAMLSSAGYWEYKPELLASILAPAQ